MPVFERILWRILRGNLCMNYSEIEEPLQDPETDQKIEKNVFIIFAHGDAMIQKIKRVSELLGANLYHLDVDQEIRRENSLKIFSKIEEIHNVNIIFLCVIILKIEFRKIININYNQH